MRHDSGARQVYRAVKNRLWHPWIRVHRLMRDVLTSKWDAEQWIVGQGGLRRAKTERKKVEAAGWFN